MFRFSCFLIFFVFLEVFVMVFSSDCCSYLCWWLLRPRWIRRACSRGGIVGRCLWHLKNSTVMNASRDGKGIKANYIFVASLSGQGHWREGWVKCLTLPQPATEKFTSAFVRPKNRKTLRKRPLARRNVWFPWLRSTLQMLSEWFRQRGICQWLTVQMRWRNTSKKLCATIIRFRNSLASNPDQSANT